MSKSGKNIVDEKIKRNEKMRNELVNKKLKELNNKLYGSAFNIENYMKGPSLTEQYHDLINKKDKLNAKQKRTYNQAYNQIDVELYKLNKKLDFETRKIENKIKSKKEELINQSKYY